MTDKMEFNEEMATEYDKGVRRTLPTYDAVLKLMLTYLRVHTTQQAHVLILGAGGGNELATLGPRNPGWRFTAVDPATPMLEIARTKAAALEMADRVEFLEGTVEEVTADQLHDAATCMLVLHFVPEIQEKLQQLKAIRQRLKPGAPFVLASMFGNPDDPAFEEQFLLWKAYWLDSTRLTQEEVDEMEKTVRTLSFIPEDEIVRLLSDAGFGKIAKFFSTNMFGGWVCRAM